MDAFRKFIEIGKIKFLIVFFFILSLNIQAQSKDVIILSNKNIRLEWKKEENQWKLKDFSAIKDKSFISFGKTDGAYSIIHSTEKPSREAMPIVENGDTLVFPERTFKYVFNKYQRGISEVPMNKAGIEEKFYPTSASFASNKVIFSSETSQGKYSAVWELSEENDSEINISVVFKPNSSAYYSLPSVNIASLDEKEISWCGVPGFFMGNKIQKTLSLSYTYGHGLPKYPIICRESTISTMVSFLQNQDGLCYSITPSPEHIRNPYEMDKITYGTWNVGLSHMARNGNITPTAYHPVLGENKSLVEAGDSICFNYTIRLKNEDWYASYKNVIYNHYHFSDFLALKRTEQSLSDRLLMLYDYILDEQKAMWNKESFNGKIIAAQSYHSGVTGADKDAMKNSDIGAIWMLSKLTNDTRLSDDLLPYIRNFKIEQQVKNGFFKGAVEGQYYLAKSKKFTEEWGNHFEPTAITYYTMMDLGNILLFEQKEDPELKQLLKNGAERLLEWQNKDGSWDLAYDRTTHEQIYTDLKDLRPTFYGQIIAYKTLKNKKYLESAIKGADWVIENAVKKLNFVGVCGDARFVNDFSTIQCSMALFDLYEITSDKKYLDAAIKTARYYTTSIYTQPIANNDIKDVKGKNFYDWQLSPCGLGFEHGGVMGSAVDLGPILLASHCSYFVKLFSLTQDSLFIDMARAGALGRDAFINKETGVASYYWTRLNQGSGPFPHHAIWQIGWIYDYLVSEAELRSNGKVSFPRGFMTPKVGSHKSLGFEHGKIEKEKVELFVRKNLVRINNPNIDYITAISLDKSKVYIILLNQQSKQNSIQVDLFDKKNRLVKTEKLTIDGFGERILKIENSIEL